MIHVEKQPEPKAPGFDFDKEVRQLGLSALAELTGQPPTAKRPGPPIKKRAECMEDITPAMLREYPYWTRALDVLHEAYHGICAYACFYIEPLTNPTVDHFVAIHNSTPSAAYEWDNYRLACSLMNSRKSDIPDALDPCEIQDGLFVLDLGSFEVDPGEDLAAEMKVRVKDTIELLKLNSQECKKMRRRYFHRYWQPRDPDRPVPLWSLEEDAPFLAREMLRQGRVRPEDLPQQHKPTG